MTVWFTSDTHFGHVNIIKYCVRPFRDVNEMNRELVARWNARVAPGDLVYHLGDFAFGSRDFIRRVRESLNGKVVLVRGNHDKSAPAMLDCGFEAVVESYYARAAFKLDVLMVHKPFEMPWQGEAVRLCGHVHELWAERKWLSGPVMDQVRVVNVGVDVRDYEPKTLEELLGESP